jgi:hypothetical protein
MPRTGAIVKVYRCIGPNHEHAFTFSGIDFHCLRNIIVPHCECLECEQQFRSELQQQMQIMKYVVALTDNEASSKASNLVLATRDNLEYLREQCLQKGSIILTTWKNNSRAEREKLLLQVDPDIYRKQWCDAYFDAEWMKEFENARDHPKDEGFDLTRGRNRRQYRNACLLPYINLEALSTDPTKFPSLIYNRVKYSPEQWAPFDNTLLNRNWQMGSFATEYNGNSICMHGERFGQLEVWEPQRAHSWSSVGFPRGVLLLEAQNKLSAFLRGLTEKILEGHQTKKGSSQIDFFSTTLGLELEKSQHHEFAYTYLNQPFSAPPSFSLQALELLAQTRVNFHGDHLWLLQTDPSYIRLHAPNLICGTFQESLTNIDVHVVLSLYIMEDCWTFWIWEWIAEELQQLLSAIDQPFKYEKALGSLEALIYSQMKLLSIHLRSILPLRPGFRKKWKIQVVPGQHQQTITITALKRVDKKFSIEHLFHEDRLEYCLSELVRGDIPPELGRKISAPRPFANEPAMVFGILDEQLSASQAARKKANVDRLDEILYSKYSDLSALHQMLAILRLHRPKYPRCDLDEALKTETGKGWRYIRKGFQEQDHRRSLKIINGEYKDADQINNRETSESMIAAKQALGSLLKEFLSSKTPKRFGKDQKWLDRDAAERTALSKFWAQMRARHEQTLRRLHFCQDDIDSDLKALSADSNPEHLTSIQSEREAVLAKIAVLQAKKQEKPKEAPEALLPSEIQTQWGESQEVKDEATERKLKIKTRSENGPQRYNLAGLLQDVGSVSLEENLEPIKVTVSKKSVEVFQSMFPDRPERSKRIAWVSFVGAMAEGEVGFVASHSAGGAAVQ